MKLNYYDREPYVRPLSLSNALKKPVAGTSGTIKLLRVMKITTLMLTIFCVSVSANYLAQVTISGKQITLERVFKTIHEQTEYVFFYNIDDLKLAKPVNIQVKNATVETVMKLVMEGQPLEYSIEDKTILVARKKKEDNPGISPPINVTGKVINEKGEPIPGVSVIVKGTDKVTTTDQDGSFTISSIERNSLLQFSSVNMEPLSLYISGKTEILVKMQAKVNELNDVTITINTGYERISKERFIGSATKIDSSLFQRQISTNLITRLDGITNGLLFDKRGGGIEPSNKRGLARYPIHNL